MGTKSKNRWRAIVGETYYYIGTTGRPVQAFERGSETDDARWSIRNYFRTANGVYFAIDCVLTMLATVDFDENDDEIQNINLTARFN